MVVDRRRVGVVEFPVKKTVVVGKREREREREVLLQSTLPTWDSVFLSLEIYL